MADQISAIMADLTRYTEGEVIGLTLEVTATLREITPVDTGWARANWVPSIGEPAPAIAARKAKPTAADTTSAAGRGASGEAEVLGWKLGGGPLFCTNGVPYIQALNEGWSNQAPAAFVQIGMAAALAAFEVKRR